MESVVVVRRRHILGAGDDAPLAVAEPQAVNDQRIVPVHHQPEQEAGHKAGEKGNRTVEYAEHHRKHHCDDQAERQLCRNDLWRAPLPSAGNQPKLLGPCDDGGRVGVDHGQRITQAV